MSSRTGRELYVAFAMAALAKAAANYGDTIDTPASTPDPKDAAAALASLKAAAREYARALRRLHVRDGAA